MTANEKTTSKKQTSRFLPLIGLLGGAILLLTLACIAFYFFFIRGINGEIANTDMIQKITVEFVTALRAKDYLTAQSMFSEKNRNSIKIETLESLASENSIVEYKHLNVCEFKVFFGQSGKHFTGSGLLQYEGGVMKFESTLLQNREGKWEMYGFFLKPNTDTTPWGACKNQDP